MGVAQEAREAVEGNKLADEAAKGFREATEAVAEGQEEGLSDGSDWQLAEDKSFQEFCAKIEERLASLEMGASLGPNYSEDFDRVYQDLEDLRADNAELREMNRDLSERVAELEARHLSVKPWRGVGPGRHEFGRA